MGNEPVRRGAWLLTAILTGLQLLVAWGSGQDMRVAIGEAAGYAMVLLGGAEVIRGTVPTLTQKVLRSPGTFGPESVRAIATYAAQLDPRAWRDTLRSMGLDPDGAPELIGADGEDVEAV